MVGIRGCGSFHFRLLLIAFPRTLLPAGDRGISYGLRVFGVLSPQHEAQRGVRVHPMAAWSFWGVLPCSS